MGSSASLQQETPEKDLASGNRPSLPPHFPVQTKIGKVFSSQETMSYSLPRTHSEQIGHLGVSFEKPHPHGASISCHFEEE